jgi:transcriptional regulator with XRE-family HTH domain
MDVGQLLRQMRKGAGMSQEALSEELYIERSSISKLERNQLELRATDLLRWTDITQNQELLAATILSIDVSILQQALELATSSTLAGLILGGIL